MAIPVVCSIRVATAFSLTGNIATGAHLWRVLLTGTLGRRHLPWSPLGILKVYGITDMRNLRKKPQGTSKPHADLKVIQGVPFPRLSNVSKQRWREPKPLRA